MKSKSELPKETVEASAVNPTVDLSKVSADPSFKYTAVEQPFVDRLVPIVLGNTKSIVEEGHLWFDLRAAVKSAKGRFDVLYASLNCTHSRVYYAISQYEESPRPIDLPADVVEFMDRHGFTVTPPAATDIDPLTDQPYTPERFKTLVSEVTSMRKAAEKAFRPFEAKGLSKDPETRERQLNSICIKSVAQSASQGPVPDESDLILRDANAVFTRSYAREVGKSHFDKEGRFLGFYAVGDKKKANLISVAAGQIDAREREWLRTFGAVFAPFEGIFGSPPTDESKNFLLRYLQLGRGTKTLKALEAGPSEDPDELSRIAF
jgi:hypothetical protein